MNKKLLAVAVAGALAAPAAAMAQVTISGIFKVGVSNISMGGTVTPGRANDSQLRVDDNSSRILFNVTEDLGGGLAAIAQLDVRFAPDQAGAAPANNPIGSGNTYVGLRSTSWGTVSLGRWDLHYGKQPDDLASKAGALMASSVSLMDYQAAGTVAVANATRTANVIKWDSPNWGGLQLTAAYSTSPLAASSEGDMGVAPGGDGAGMNFAAAYTAANWQIGASIWEAETEAVNTAVATTAANYINPRTEQSSQSVWGYIRFGGFKIGAGANMAELTTAGTTVSDRMSLTLPVSYVTGPHNFYATFTQADDDDATVATDGAQMISVAYVYDLSKRTSVGITYSQIDNDTAGRYNFFTGTSLGSADAAVGAGEDPTLIQLTLRHAF
ncbi:MAG TPA: porin [Burkholderiales bacterium]|jgi:predicted porin|nr:porin [Burkholderiales bacterium]